MEIMLNYFKRQVNSRPNVVTIFLLALAICTSIFGRSPWNVNAQAKKIKSMPQESTYASQQIESLEAEKNRRNAVERKIDSQLLQAVRESRGERMTPDANLEPVHLDVDARGKVNVDITTSVTPATLEKLRKLGAEISFSSAEYKTVRARVPFSKVESIAGIKEVTFIKPAVRALNNRMVRPPAHGNAVDDVPKSKP
jgi:hypothetical protein